MKYLVILVIIFLSSPIMAQISGLKVGLTFGVSNTNIYKHTILKKRYNPNQNLTLSLILSKSLNYRTAIVFDGFFSARGGYFFTNEVELFGVYRDTFHRFNKNSFFYFDFPLLIQYKIIHKKKLSIWLGLGGYYSILLKQKWFFTLHNKFTSIEKKTIQLNYDKYDYGIIGKIEGQLKLSAKFSLLSSLKYMHGFNNIVHPYYEVKSYHQLLSFNLGILLNLDAF